MTAAGARRDSATAALLIALAGFATLSVGDAIVKTLAGEWPGTAVAALRYAIGLIGLALAVAAVHGRAGFICPRPGLQLARGAAVSLATLGFFFSVQLIPLADATAVTFTSPMITAVLSALLLGEKADRAVWIAIALAFAGVLIVVRPALGFDPARLLPLGSAFGMAALMLLNRTAAGLAPLLTMQLLIATFATLILVPVAVVGHLSGVAWLHASVPDWTIVARVTGVAVTGTLSHLLIYLATTRASAATIAPMTYVQLLVAMLAGWLWFGNPPGLATCAGAALIIGGGLYLFRARRPARSDPEASGVPD